jgi:hypothetical protein
MPAARWIRHPRGSWDMPSTVGFKHYYEFYESKFVMGDTHHDIQTEFENPPDSVWQYLTFRLHPHLRIEAKPFIDNYEELDILMGDDKDFQYQKVVIDHDDHGDIAYDIVDIGGWMMYNHSLKIQDLITAMIDNGNVGNLCSGKYQDSLDSVLSEDFTNDYSEYNEMDDSYILNENKHRGTVCTIDDIVNCCVINAACCALRYNKHSLRDYRRTLFAAPLKEELLGIAHRIRPSLSPNRALDVNLCFLQVAFLEHKSLTSSIKAYTRCDVTTMHIETLIELMYQIILLRFTGRICRFKEYRKFQELANKPGVVYKLLPLRRDTKEFLSYMERRQQKHKGQNGKNVTLTGWVSRQHNGVIPSDLKMNLYKFQLFMTYISDHVGTSVRNMQKKNAIVRHALKKSKLYYNWQNGTPVSRKSVICLGLPMLLWQI